MLRNALVIATVLVLGTGRPVSGQSDSWQRVQALPANAKIEVFLVSNKTETGTLSEVSQDVVTLTNRRGSLQLARSEIRQIWMLGKGSRLKNVGIAAAVGFAVGCPIGAAKAGYLSDMNNPSIGTKAGFCLGIGGFVGGIAAGVVAPFPATKRMSVYRSASDKR